MSSYLHGVAGAVERGGLARQRSALRASRRCPGRRATGFATNTLGATACGPWVGRDGFAGDGPGDATAFSRHEAVPA
jgi:hypothetical protein